jgi:hypothetical protein
MICIDAAVRWPARDHGAPVAAWLGTARSALSLTV